MLMRTEPFRELDRLAQELLGSGDRPSVIPLDAYRKGDQFFVQFDLPGVDPGSIDLTIEKNVLTVKAERPAVDHPDARTLVAERPSGTFTRQLFLGDTLDAEHIEARYTDGVLAVTIPVHEAAKPRKVQITAGKRQKELAAVS